MPELRPSGFQAIRSTETKAPVLKTDGINFNSLLPKATMHQHPSVQERSLPVTAMSALQNPTITVLTFITWVLNSVPTG